MGTLYKYGVDITTHSKVSDSKLRSIIYDIVSGQYDRGFLNLETLTTIYNFAKIRNPGITYNLSDIIKSWMAYEEALEMLQSYPRDNRDIITTEYFGFWDLNDRFNPVRYKMTTENINEMLFDFAIKRGSLAKALYYAEKLSKGKLQTSLTRDILSRFEPRANNFGLTIDDFIEFSSVFPWVDMLAIKEIVRVNEDFVFKMHNGDMYQMKLSNHQIL